MTDYGALSPDPIKIGMLLFDGFNAMALHAFLDPLRSANYLHGDTLYHWTFFGIEGGEVRASNGLLFADLVSDTSSLSDFDLIVVNSSWGVERFRGHSLMNDLREAAARGAAFCGLDTGSFILAFAGLLQDRRVTLHYEHIAAFRELFPDIQTLTQIFVIDRDRLTCSGGLAAADLSLELIRQQHGLPLANASGRYIFQDRLRSGEEDQFPETREPIGYSVPKKLRDAIIVMERNLEQILPIGAIASRTGLSQRQLDRLFQQHTGVSPVRYYLNARLDRARGLITQTELPILDVAIACGFNSHAQFTRTYKARFDIAPSKDRIEGRIPFQFRSFPSHAGL